MVPDLPHSNLSGYRPDMDLTHPKTLSLGQQWKGRGWIENEQHILINGTIERCVLFINFTADQGK